MCQCISTVWRKDNCIDCRPPERIHATDLLTCRVHFQFLSHLLGSTVHLLDQDMCNIYEYIPQGIELTPGYDLVIYFSVNMAKLHGERPGMNYWTNFGSITFLQTNQVCSSILLVLTLDTHVWQKTFRHRCASW